VLGIMVAARLGEEVGRPRDDTVNLGIRLVVAGVVGSRITWVLTHLDQIDSPIDLIAVWEGGLQFSGGFVAAVLVGLPTFLRWDRLTRWRMLDRVMLGLAIGMGVGRIGCYAVGEHLGGLTSFPLASRYDGGATREGNGGTGRLLEAGDVIHNTSLYEMVHVFALAGVLWWLIRRRSSPGTALAVFLLWYGAARFGTDFLRTYDDTVAGLTGAQLMCLVLVPVGGGGLEAFLRSDLSYESKRYVQVDNLSHTGDSWLWNVAAGVESDAWTLQLWVENLLDDRTPAVVTRLIDNRRGFVSIPNGLGGRQSTFFRDFLIAAPRKRQVGVSATYRF